MHRFDVGQLRCTVLDDGRLLLRPELIFPSARRAEWPPVALDPHGYLHVSINCLLIESGAEVVLIDTGNGTKRGKWLEGGGNLLSDLRMAGKDPRDVTIVVLSHIHVDHVGGATRLTGRDLVPVFPRARHLAPRADWDFYTAPEQIAHFDRVRDSVMPVHDRGLLELVEGETTVAPGIHLVPAPGHTPGLNVVVLSSPNQKAMFLSDLFHHHVQFEHPDMVRDTDVLREKMAASRRGVIRSALESSALLVTAHEDHPGMGRLVLEDGHLRFRQDLGTNSQAADK